MGDIEDYVRRNVDAAPPLTPEQRDRLAVLLRPPGLRDPRYSVRHAPTPSDRPGHDPDPPQSPPGA
jgi:hypothetical protein